MNLAMRDSSHIEEVISIMSSLPRYSLQIRNSYGISYNLPNKATAPQAMLVIVPGPISGGTSSLTSEQTQVKKGTGQCQHTNTVVRTKLVTQTSNIINTHTCELEPHLKRLCL